MKFPDITLIITATITALMAGFFFSYSIFVSLGLGKLADKEFLGAMQNINKEVQNPLFFVCFFGTLIMLPITSFLHYNQHSFVFLFLATLFYLFGVFLVTIFGNIPLNNKLEIFDISKATETTAKHMRNTFENSWNFWNNIRTFASLNSIFFLILDCVFNKAN
ncbi:DUF1772 domain-containing protein [Flavobacterium sp. LB2P74]|uniref:anthrone oxygenase family protein n=1 Tax=Flavobacterium sp. LB2P74 TaxID=3401717 RepID=UPI003AAA2BE6